MDLLGGKYISFVAAVEEQKKLKSWTFSNMVIDESSYDPFLNQKPTKQFRITKQKILITTVVTEEETKRLQLSGNTSLHAKHFFTNEFTSQHFDQSKIGMAKPIFESLCCRSCTIKIFTRATPLVTTKIVTSLPFSCILPCSLHKSLCNHTGTYTDIIKNFLA